MKRFLRRLVALAFLLVAVAIGYGWLSYRDARAMAPELVARADALIAAGRGGDGLGADRRALLLAVEDPSFTAHVGVDFTTPGAGPTTITQSLADHLGFASFAPGLGSIRQTGFALGLEARLTKAQILALYLDTAEMGPAPDGPNWITGFHAASEAHFGASPDRIAFDDFVALVAVLIAPGDLGLAARGPDLEARIARISALAEGRCAPAGHDDVWLEGCAGS